MMVSNLSSTISSTFHMCDLADADVRSELQKLLPRGTWVMSDNNQLNADAAILLLVIPEIPCDE